MPRSSTILTFILAWLLFFVLLTLYIANYGNDGSTALRMGLWATGTAAALSLGVWWLSGRHPWPDRLQPAFLGLHLLAALFFILVWTTVSYLRPLLLAGQPLFDAIKQAQFLNWYLLIGLLLYGIVGGSAMPCATNSGCASRNALPPVPKPWRPRRRCKPYGLNSIPTSSSTPCIRSPR